VDFKTFVADIFSVIHPRGKKLIAIKAIIGNLWQSLAIFDNL
jgi:hypothetical protein